MKKKYIAAQLGARMHYAIPRILHSHEMLEHFYTDISIDKSWPRVFKGISDRLISNELKRLKSRKLPTSIVSKTTTFPLIGAMYALRRLSDKGDIYSNHIRAGDEFSKNVLRRGFGNANALFTYNSAGLLLLQNAKDRGLFCVMEQTIAPKKIEIELLTILKEMFPQWVTHSNLKSNQQLIIDRQAEEWELADKIICGSSFVKNGIKSTGGDVGKCFIVPYGVPGSFNNKEKKYIGGRKLRVLVAGEVGLRKGSPFVLNVAKRLMDKIEVRMAGPIAIPNICRSELAKYVDLLGMIPRNQILDQFHWADVFFLPSVCEGSATVTYEAICAGLPVVCTENTGSIIQNNFDGFVVASMDEDAMVNSLENLADDVNLYKKFVRNVKESASNANLEAYSNRFIEAVS